MTMTKFEPVAYVDEDDDNKWATLVDDLDIKLNAPLYTADQLTEAYEAGKLDAVPEGWVLVPMEPDEEMELRGAECTNSIDWGDCPGDAPYELASAVYAAMITAAPKGLK